MKARALTWLLPVLTAACGASDGGLTKHDAAVISSDAIAGDTSNDGSGDAFDGGGLSRDAISGRDAAIVDAPSTPDVAWFLPDAGSTCRVDISAITPASLVNLTAGPTALLRVQGTVVWGDTVPFQPVWTWSVIRSDGQSVDGKPVGGDPSQVQFAIAIAGRYDITADIGGGCTGTARALAQDPQSQSRTYHVRALPPASVPAAVPYEVDLKIIAGGAPTTRDIDFDTGTPVAIDPATGASLVVAVPSFIRIQSSSSAWITSGRSSNQGPFRTVLDPLLEYQVLVVPDPSADGSDAIAPFLLGRSTSGNVKVDTQYLAANADPLLLPKGIAISGHLVGANGPVAGASISLQSYQSSSTAGQTDLLFSTVGQADGNGAYTLLVNPLGAFSIIITPPPGTTLPVPITDQPINLTGASTFVPDLDFEWLALPTTNLTLAVALPDGSLPSDTVAIHLESSAPLPAGTLSFGAAVDAGSDTAPQELAGTIRLDGSTDRYGVATFPNLPKGSYSVTLIPPASLSSWGITKATVDATLGDALRIGVSLAPKIVVMGRLLDANDGAATDSAGASVVATDTGHDTIAPSVTALVAADGTFFLALDPERTYSLAARPVAGRGLPAWVPLYGFSTGRTNMQLDDQRIPTGVLVQGHMTYAGSPVGGAVVQAFCVGLLPDCEDRTNLAAGSPPPFASATSDGSGSYAFYLPAPAASH